MINTHTKNFKALLSISLPVLPFAFGLQTSHAAADFSDFSGIGDIIGRIINIALLAAGGILVAMIAYGVWKSSLAVGDPRGLEGAKSTWTYALYGFFVVIGVFAIYAIITGVIGISAGGGPSGLIGKALDALNQLLQNP
jgi:hypothetical protein